MEKFLLTSLTFFYLLMGSLGSSFAQKFNANGFQQFQIGDIQAIVLSDGYIPFASVQPTVAPMVNPDSVNAVLQSQFRKTNSFEISMNVLLLRKGDRLILFDAGYGSLVGENSGKLIRNLALVGISPQQITDVVLTHAHRDHIGGLVDAQGRSVYSKATIYMSQVEYDFWTKGAPDFSRSKLKDETMIRDMTQFIRKSLFSIAPQIKKIADGDTILDCIQLTIAPGHTDGHLVSTIFSKNDKLLVIADVIHLDAILFQHPEWGISFDSNFELGITSRLRILNEASQTKSLIFGFHLPYPGVGHVKKIGNASYEYVPKAFFIND